MPTKISTTFYILYIYNITFTMRFLTLTLIISLYSCFSFAQNDTANYPYWIDMMQDENANFRATQSAFYKYWENRPITPGCGYKPFKRWEHRMQMQVDAQGNKPSPTKTIDEMSTFNAHRSSNGNWKPLGPNFNQTTNYGDIPGVGRFNTIAFHPTDTNVIYVGAPAGGLWITYDYGVSWETHTDQLASLGVSAIIVDYDNPNTIYIGTGDRDASDAVGLGVYKSTDGGITFTPSNNGMGNVTVNEMRQHPDSSDVIFAATTGGIFRTADAGANWTQVTTYTGNYLDLEYKPGDPSTMYCVATNRFFKSSDGGFTWQVYFGIPLKNRMFIAVTPANPNKVYAVISNQRTFAGLWSSDDSGDSFTEQSNSPNILGYADDGSDATGGQAWYDLGIEADRFDPETVYVVGIKVFKSTNGGVDWFVQTNGSHVDMHYIKAHPLTDDIYLANDGGIYKKHKDALDWTDISQNLVTGMIYKIGQSATNVDDVVCGFQDNGTSIFEGASWGRILGGDGMDCTYDKIDGNYVYASIYYGSIYRSTNGGQSTSKIADNGTNNIDEDGAWVTPFVIAEHDNGTMYAGYKNVWRTTRLKEAERDSVLWEDISNGLGNTNVDCDLIEHSPADQDLLYVTKDATLYKSENCNDPSPSWNSVNSGPFGGNINGLECHPTHPDVLYVTKTGGIAVTSDRGASWTDITGNLPNITYTALVFDKSTAGGIYLGSYAGVFYKDSSMTDWVMFGDGMPTNIEITDIEIYYNQTTGLSERLRASTYGRGLWESDLHDTTSTTYFPSTPLLSLTENNEKQTVYEEFDININFYKNLNNVEVNGLDISDFYISNGTISNLTGGPIDYSMTVTPNNPGVIEIMLPSSVIMDIDNIANLISDTLKVNYSNNFPQMGYEGPGGVGFLSEMALWLNNYPNIKDNLGNVYTTDQMVIESWKDDSPDNNTVEQTDVNHLPIVGIGANGISGLDAIQFSEIIEDQGDYLTAKGVRPGKNFAVFSVAQSDTVNFNDHGWIASARMNNGFIIHPQKNNNYFYNVVISETDDYFSGDRFTTDDASIPHIYSFTYCENDLLGYMLSGFDGQTIENTDNTNYLRNEVDTIDINYGRDYNNRWAHGKMGEHFIYNKGLGKSHFKIVRNYMATKFLIDLGADDLYAHDQSFRFNLAGIGKENEFDYHNDAQGTGIVRMKSATSLENDDYLLWADDDLTTDSWGETGIYATERIERTWQVDERNDVGEIEFRIAANYLPNTANVYAVLVSSTSDFSQNTYAYQLSSSNDTLIASIDFTDDNFFTVITATEKEIELINANFTALNLIVTPTLSNGDVNLIVSDKDALNGTIGVYNLIGQEIFKENVSGQNVFNKTLSNLAAGKYIVRYSNDETSLVEKFVVVK